MANSAEYAFGPFLVLPAPRLLLRNGTPQPLTPKAFDALLALLERRDRVVPKEELMGLLWGTSIVEEANLTQQIFLLRKALGDTSEGSAYIATVARHGYRFVGAVEIHAQSSEVPPTRGRQWALPIVALLLLAVIVGAGWLARRSSARVNVQRVAASILPPDGLALTNGIALSPDGRFLVFTAARPDGTGGLWLRPVGALESHPLEGTEGALYPFWSPDSRSIAFFAQNLLKRIDVGGGTPQVLAPVAGSRGGTWGSRGQIVFSAGVRSVLWCVPEQGGVPTACTGLDPARMETGHRWPHFLPDGRHVVFMTRSNRATARFSLALAAIGDAPGAHRTLEDADTGAMLVDDQLLYIRGRILFARPFQATSLAFAGPAVPILDDVWRSWGVEGLHGCTAARTGLVACRRGASDSQLIWVDRHGRELASVGPRNAANPALSPDDTRLLYSLHEEERRRDSLWIADRDGSNAARLTPTYMNVETQVWSPDGARVAFASEHEGEFDLYELSLASPDRERKILSTPRTKMLGDWSPDGRWLLFHERDTETLEDIRIVAAGGGPTRDVVRTAAQERFPRFSPDGRWIVYTSDATGREEVFLRLLEGRGGRIRVSTSGGKQPQWRRDGRELYFVGSDGKLLAAPVHWTGGTPAVGTPAPLFERTIYQAEYEYDYCPDKTGEHFLINTLLNPGSIALLADWRRTEADRAP